MLVLARCATRPSGQQSAQCRRSDIVDMSERRRYSVDLGRCDTKILEVVPPLARDAPDIGNYLAGSGTRQREHLVRLQCVVKRGQATLRTDAQMQETLCGVARTRQDVRRCSVRPLAGCATSKSSAASCSWPGPITVETPNEHDPAFAHRTHLHRRHREPRRDGCKRWHPILKSKQLPTSNCLSRHDVIEFYCHS